MKYDFYADVPLSQRNRILRAQQILFEKILRDVPFESALEIGPGLGGFAKFCTDRGSAYCAIEENPRIAACLKEQNYDILVGSIHDVKLPTAPRDLILLSHVLEHLGTFSEAASVLQRLKPLLSPDGSVVLLCPDIEWTGVGFYQDYTHTFPTSLRALRKMLVDLDMQIVRSGRYVGRWLKPWKLLWAVRELSPIGLLPDRFSESIDVLFMVNCYLVARPQKRTSRRRTDRQQIPIERNSLFVRPVTTQRAQHAIIVTTEVDACRD